MSQLPSLIHYREAAYKLAFNPKQQTPEQYRAEHGFCPDGYRWNGKQCVEKDKAHKPSPAVEEAPLKSERKVREKKVKPELTEEQQQKKEERKQKTVQRLADQKRWLETAKHFKPFSYTRPMRRDKETGETVQQATIIDPRARLPMVQESGVYVTEHGKQIGSVQPLPGWILEKNIGQFTDHGESYPAYDPKSDDTYYMIAWNPESGEHRAYYTAHYHARQNQKKHDHMAEVAKQYPAAASKAEVDLRSKDPRKRIMALAFSLMQKTLARVGSRSSEASDKGTLGLTSLKNNNIKLQGDRLVFTYPGKAGVLQKHVVKGTPEEIALIKELKAGRKRKDYLFVYPHPTRKNKLMRVDDSSYNDYLQELGFDEQTTAKTLRPYHGTREALKRLERLHIPRKVLKDEKRFTRYVVNEAIKPVSKILGHTSPTTTIKHYIDPVPIMEFFKKYGFELPTRYRLDKPDVEEEED